jgi:hypothetical protein
MLLDTRRLANFSNFNQLMMLVLGLKCHDIITTLFYIWKTTAKTIWYRMNLIASKALNWTNHSIIRLPNVRGSKSSTNNSKYLARMYQLPTLTSDYSSRCLGHCPAKTKC